jgi:tRNA nucleotidyltransferase (CCA-adding enzyme)
VKIYLVGGAVRDGLLGLTVHERDYVVVGATPERLLDLGFRPVGKDFPVFLHPETHEEYALARTERKTERGYHGFVFHAASDVSLEEDLRRRDLTINAIAKGEDGSLMDPYGGIQDLDARILRHVSPAFSEDPVRILRVARFMARFGPLGFRVADETLCLMRQMVEDGEVDALVPERVFQEFQKALSEPAPELFLEVLEHCGALAVLFPEIAALRGVPQDPRHHPEVDTWIHARLVLQAAATLSQDPRIRFAALVHDLGKALTDPRLWPSHPDHEVAGLKPLDTLCERLRVPQSFSRLAQRSMQFHGGVHKALTLDAEALVNLVEQLDGLRQPEVFEDVLIVCETDAKGRPGYENISYPQADRLRKVLEWIQSVKASDLADSGLKGPQLGEALRCARIKRVRLGLLTLE